MFTDKLTLAIAEAAKKCMEEGSLGYVAFGHDGKRHEVYANSSYEAKQKAVSHFKTPKSKQHLVSVTLAQKDGKDVVHTATESVQESKLDDILDARRAKEADGYTKTEKPVATKKEVPGIRYGGKNQKPEKENEIEEGAVPSTEKTVTVKHKTSGKELVVTARSVPEYVKGGYHPIKESMSNPGLESFASKVRAERTGKASNPALEKIAHEKAKEKYLKKEEVEEIDEVSKGLLGRYITKASLKAAGHAYNARDTSSNDNKSGEHIDKTFKRLDGIKTAVSKLAKEEVEELDEVSKELLGRYVKRASRDGAHKSALAQAYSQNFDKSIDMNRIAIKRKKGIDKAVDKLTKEDLEDYTLEEIQDFMMSEEFEQLDEISKKTLGSYVKKASLDVGARGLSNNNTLDAKHLNTLSKMSSRVKNINKAVDKLTKEEVEELDEISKTALGNYAKAAAFDIANKGSAVGKAGNNLAVLANPKGPLTQLNKRLQGHAKAVGKLTKEQVEDTQDLNESKAHIEQHLADRDINSKVTGNVVKVHSSDVSATKKHIQNAGYKDHKVVGGLNEEKMSDEDMSQREKIVKGMKKNLQGFKARYGDDAKKVMYATATKQAMKEGAVPSTEKTVTVKHHKSGKELVVTANSAEKYKSLGYHTVKEEVEQLVEREESPTKGTRKVASYGNHEHTAEVRYNPEYQEYQVHHYKNGKHQGEGPVSYHYDDKEDAHSTAKHSVGIKESVEQIDEISNKLKKDYREKAHVDLFKSANTTIGAVVKKDADKEKEFRAKWQKRIKGIGMVDKKLAREEVDSDTFNSELADNKAKAAGTKKQPDIAKASVQAVKQESFSEILSMIKEGVRPYLKGKNNG